MTDRNGFDGFAGFRQRSMLTERSKKAMFLGPLFVDLFMQVQ